MCIFIKGTGSEILEKRIFWTTYEWLILIVRGGGVLETLLN